MNQRNNVYDDYSTLFTEILKHKWIESEKVGYDIGFERALTDWISNHRNNWISSSLHQK